MVYLGNIFYRKNPAIVGNFNEYGIQELYWGWLGAQHGFKKAEGKMFFFGKPNFPPSKPCPNLGVVRFEVAFEPKSDLFFFSVQILQLVGLSALPTPLTQRSAGLVSLQNSLEPLRMWFPAGVVGPTGVMRMAPQNCRTGQWPSPVPNGCHEKQPYTRWKNTHHDSWRR